MKILIASDHAGFEMKEALKAFLESLQYEVKDFGAFSYDENDDYPDFVIPLAKEISANLNFKGIILGGSGQGEAICANRFPNVRAVVFNGPLNHVTESGEKKDEIILSREHNDANVLSLGARFLSIDEAKDSVKLWLATEFSGEEKHLRRIQKIENLK